MKASRVIVSLIVLVSASLVLAWIWKEDRSMSEGGFEKMTWREAKAEGQKIWLDARPPRAFMEGHYPGAINIPATWRGEEIERQIENLRHNHEGEKILIYCNPPPCNDSEILANRLKAEGIKNIAILIEGYVPEKN